MPRRDRPWLALTVLLAGFFVTLLDTSIVNVAVPRLRQDLGAGLDQVLWVINGYLLALAVPLIAAGRLGDRFGPKRVYLAGLATFTLAGALCGAATGIEQLIVARVLAGIGAAVLGPQTFALITVLFSPDRRGAALGLWGSVAAVATATGPLAGGLIVDTLGWRWIFLLNVPVGLLGLLLAAVVAPDPRPGRWQRLDVSGMILISSALLALSFGLLEGQRYRWATVAGPVSIPLLLAAGVVLLAAFVIRQRAVGREPLVPPRLFASRNFAVATVVMLCFGFAMVGFALPLTLYLQVALGFGAARAGGVQAVASVASGLVAPFAGRVAVRVGRKPVLLIGLGAYASGLALLAAAADAGAGPTRFMPALLVTGVGIGCVFMLAAELAVGDVPAHLAGAASGVFNTTRQVGGVLGAAAIGALLQARIGAAQGRGELVPRAFADAIRETTALPVAVTFLGFLYAAALLRAGRSAGRSSSAPEGAPHSDKSEVLLNDENAVRS